jgi:hypothetical protein
VRCWRLAVEREECALVWQAQQSLLPVEHRSNISLPILASVFPVLASLFTTFLTTITRFFTVFLGQGHSLLSRVRGSSLPCAY